MRDDGRSNRQHQGPWQPELHSLVRLKSTQELARVVDDDGSTYPFRLLRTNGTLARKVGAGALNFWFSVAELQDPDMPNPSRSVTSRGGFARRERVPQGEKRLVVDATGQAVSRPTVGRAVVVSDSGLNGWIEVDDGSDDCPYRVRYESGAAARRRHGNDVGPTDLGRWWFAASDLFVLD